MATDAPMAGLESANGSSPLDKWERAVSLAVSPVIMAWTPCHCSLGFRAPTMAMRLHRRERGYEIS